MTAQHTYAPAPFWDAYFAADADEPRFEFEPVDISLIPPRPRKY